MANECSFDVVSDLDMQEVDNAVNQCAKEIKQRFDFRGSKSTISLEGDTEIRILADDEYKLKNVIDILQTKAIKRGISLKNFDYGKMETASQSMVRQSITLKKGIQKEKAKEIVAAIKNMKLKVQGQIMDDQVRVVGKDKDDLQRVIGELKLKDFGVDLQFVNFRS